MTATIVYRTVDMAHKHTSDAHLGQSTANLVADGEKIGATGGDDTLFTVDSLSAASSMHLTCWGEVNVVNQLILRTYVLWNTFEKPPRSVS
jgi:hypothetical protein